VTVCWMRQCPLVNCSIAEHQRQRRLGHQQLRTATGGHPAGVSVRTADVVLTTCWTNVAGLQPSMMELAHVLYCCVAASKVVWKRAIQGVREMCDACDATLFNVHWTCGKCGFAVCADCYRAKRVPPAATAPRPRDSAASAQDWMTCSANRQIHEPASLISTQIIPSDGKLTDYYYSARPPFPLRYKSPDL